MIADDQSSECTSTAHQACILRVPETKSLTWLLDQLEIDITRGAATAQQKSIFTFLASKRREIDADEDACVMWERKRLVSETGKRRETHVVIYELCTPGVDDISGRSLMICANSGAGCINPRHCLPRESILRRAKALEKSQFGTTRLTETILRRHYPDYLVRRGKKTHQVVAIYKRIPLFAQLQNHTLISLRQLRPHQERRSIEHNNNHECTAAAPQPN